MYQRDYLRAGFKMLNDPNKAVLEMKLMLVLGLSSWFLLSYQSDNSLKLPIIFASIYSMY